MARTVDPASHAIRRDAFVDAALHLIQTRGYRQMSVQDVLDAVDSSRGAFYHYFDSKGALLEAVMDRLLEVGMATVESVVADPQLSATQKFANAFAGIVSWKNARRELMLQLLKVWLSDDNAIVREKLRRGTAARLTPLLSQIIRQGCQEGVFSAPSPEDAARIVVALILGAQETAGDLYVARMANAVPLETIERTFASYATAYERVLGAAPGSLPMVDEATIQMWFS
jgi:AcrR family transcriptional regulator